MSNNQIDKYSIFLFILAILTYLSQYFSYLTSFVIVLSSINIFLLVVVCYCIFIRYRKKLKIKGIVWSNIIINYILVLFLIYIGYIKIGLITFILYLSIHSFLLYLYFKNNKPKIIIK